MDKHYGDPTMLAIDEALGGQRYDLARDILLKLIEGETRENAARVGRGEEALFCDSIVIPSLAVTLADALLAELAKPKEGA